MLDGYFVIDNNYILSLYFEY